MSTARPYALLLASLGNPPPLHTTRHSAGHILLRALALHLHAPPFQRSKAYAGGQITHAPLSSSASASGNDSITLWQCPTMMNVSGPAVVGAWKAFVAEQQAISNSNFNSGDAEVHADPSPSLGLLILHDDLETPPGTLRIRHGISGSVKGHNGLRSVVGGFKSVGLGRGMEDRLVRVGIGIGRPPREVGRERGEGVSDYVLGRVTEREREGIEGLVGDVVDKILGWDGERIGRL